MEPPHCVTQVVVTAPEGAAEVDEGAGARRREESREESTGAHLDMKEGVGSSLGRPDAISSCGK